MNRSILEIEGNIVKHVKKEIYLEKLLLAISEINNNLKKEDAEFYKNNIFFNERVIDYLEFFRLASLENKIKGGNHYELLISPSNGFPVWGETVRLSKQLERGKSKLEQTIRENMIKYHTGEGKEYNAENFLDAIALEGVRTMLMGGKAYLQRTALRDFLHYTRLLKITDKENDSEENKFLLDMFNDDATVRSEIMSKSGDKGVYKFNFYKLHKTDFLWTYMTVTLGYQQPKGSIINRSLIEEKSDGSWLPKGDLFDAFEHGVVHDFSLRSLYKQLCTVKNVQPLSMAFYTLGPFYHPEGIKTAELNRLFTNRPDAFMLMYACEALGNDPDHIIDGKEFYKEYQTKYTIATTSDVGIDFSEMFGANSVVDVTEIHPIKVDQIINRYKNSNPRFGKELESE